MAEEVPKNWEEEYNNAFTKKIPFPILKYEMCKMNPAIPNLTYTLTTTGIRKETKFELYVQSNMEAELNTIIHELNESDEAKAALNKENDKDLLAAEEEAKKKEEEEKKAANPYYSAPPADTAKEVYDVTEKALQKLSENRLQKQAEERQKEVETKRQKEEEKTKKEDDKKEDDKEDGKGEGKILDLGGEIGLIS